MKKILSVILSLALVVAFIPSGLFAVKAKAAESKTYTFSDYKESAAVNDYTKVLDEDLTVGLFGTAGQGSGYFTNELRLYQGANAFFTFDREVESIKLNVGYKDGTMDVYTSVDGTNWTSAYTAVAYTIAYGDVEFTFAPATKYVRIVATKQLRIKTMTVDFVGDGTTAEPTPDPEPTPDHYAAGEGAYYLFDVPNSDIAADKHTTTGVTGALPVVNENGENFVSLTNLYPLDSEGNPTSVETKINAADLTYGAAGVPTTIPIGDNDTATTEDLKTTYIALRIKINDNSAAFGKKSSSFQLYIDKSDDTSAALQMTTSANGRHAARWLDLKDGSMTYFWGQSGYNRVAILDRYDFTGDMDGYLLIPFSYKGPNSGGNEYTSTLLTDADLRDVFSGITVRFINAEKDQNHKASSWQDKQLLLGDAFIVNDAEKFAAARSEKRGVAGKMYRPNVEDTASYAIRVGGFRSYAWLRANRTISKAYQDADLFGYSGSYDSFYHVTTLPNGDRAYEYILNYDEPQRTNDAEGNPILTKSGTANVIAGDTYDDANVSALGVLETRAQISANKQGVPDVIDLSRVTNLAFRVATKDGTVPNEAVTFAMMVNMCRTGSSSSNVNYKLAAGEITYLDINTGKTEKLTVDGSSQITLTKNIDGYLIIPVTQFKDLTVDKIKTDWGGYVSNSYNYAATYTLPENCGWSNGKALYSGDVFFVEDAAKFAAFHCPHTDWTKGTIVAPTCKTEGYTPYTCDACGTVEKREKVATIVCDTKIDYYAHAPTCSTIGNKAGKKCSMCGEIIEGGEVLAIIACDSKVNYPAKAPTCKEAGNEAGKKCSMCGEITEGGAVLAIIACDAKLDYPAKAPTCTQEGHEAGKKCSMCGEITEGGAVIGVIPHSYDNDCDQYCNECGAYRSINSSAHKYNGVVTAPTCISEGYTTYTCSVCGYTYVGNRVEKLEHSLSELVRVEPTFEAEGYVIYECDYRCGYVRKDAISKIKAPIAKLDKATISSLAITWDEYPNAYDYYVHVSNADGYKKIFYVDTNKLIIEKLESDTEYSVKINAGYAKGSKYTGYGDTVTFKTLIDESTRLSLEINENGQSIDVTALNAIPGETYYIYRSTESGNKLVGITDTAFCTVKAMVGDNLLYAKAASTGENTAKAKIRLYKDDVKLTISAQPYIGCAHLTVSSIVDVKTYYYYRITADGKAKLVKTSNSQYYTADAFVGSNQYYVKADVVYPDGTEGVISSNTITVDIETPAMTLTCTKEGTKVKIDVASDFEITNYWIYRINAQGKSELLEATEKSTTYLPASWGTTFRVKVCIILRGKEMYLGSDNVAVA